MTLRRAEWPEVGDLVIAEVQRITDYGAYVRLEEYGKDGLLHISEVSSGWIRNIRDFIREGQKVVLKVLRVDPSKGHVDLSLRRVTKREKREKLFLWKRERKAEGLLRSASEKLKIPLEELYEKVGFLMEEKFGGLYEGFEKVAKDGEKVLLEIGVPKNIATVIAEIAKEKIRIPMVKVKGILEMQCIKPNGVKIIQQALLKAKEVDRPKGTEIKIYVIAPPKYRIEVLAENYKDAEKILQNASRVALEAITRAGGQGSFQGGK